MGESGGKDSISGVGSTTEHECRGWRMSVGDSKDLDQICVLESRSGIPGQDPN